MNFRYKALPWNIIFGVGSVLRLPEELDKLKKNRVLVLTTPNQIDQGQEIVKILGHRAAGIYDKSRMHVPVETLKEAASLISDLNVDCSLALGGGSTTGLGKALSVTEGIDNLVLPTTYAGSEMTDIWAVTEGRRKTTHRDVAAVPLLTIYDPELTLTLPPSFAAASGLNAIAQAVVNVATDNPNPIVSSLAIDAIRGLAQSLPVVVSEPDNLEARSKALYGASMAGGALGLGGTSLHHRLCHVLGGSFNSPHAETHAILLAHTVAYNSRAVPENTMRVAEAIGAKDAATGLYQLAQKLGVPLSLQDIGIRESDLDKVVTIALERPIANPEPVTQQGLRLLLGNAFVGRLDR